MQYKSDGDTYIISVEQNESVMETLTEFCKEIAIKNGQLSGIGAISNIEIGAYDLGTQEYTRTLFKDTWELVSFQGNILLKDNEPFVHAHVTISNHQFETRGGHLFDATVAIVGEFILRKISTDGKRELNPSIGLACMAFDL
ncbi:MAG: PPC domain-containing DNA-binding protein [Candidatus Neomarinimicrobiota bacterium]|nr:PPC domain-containing DNA-binding protein [Candidatus Neomarinimicrobiota bacterium]